MNHGDIVTGLVWPQGRARNQPHQRTEARFDTSLGMAIKHLLGELRRLGARYITISTELEGYEKDGRWRPYAHAREPDDPGVAVYFDWDGEQMCLSCDRWLKVKDNIRSIGKTIEAMRGIERWGSSETMKRAFVGFRHALPAAGEDWRSVLGLRNQVTFDEVRRRHRELALGAHPDHGGNQHEMVRLNQALEAAKGELDP